MPTKDCMATIVVDANIMASALMGTSLPLIVDLATRATVVAPAAQIAETRGVLVRLKQDAIDERMAMMSAIVDCLEPEVFAHFETDARARLHASGQSDWPLVAAAMALDAAIWSRDPDLFGTGIAIWSTFNIRHAARGDDASETP